jgi:TctA family transporter
VPLPGLRYIYPLPSPLEQNYPHPHRLQQLSNSHHQPKSQSSNPTRVAIAHLTTLHCNPNTITMPSIEIKNWITGLVVGILGLALASLGTVLAYKQLKRTKRPDDVENGAAESIVMRDAAVVTE